MPFADYDDFDECVSDNSDKQDPGAYCAVIKRQVEGKSEAYRAIDSDRIKAVVESDGKAMAEEIRAAQAVGQKTAVATGQHAPVRPAKVPAETDNIDLPDPSNPPEEFADALQADDFVIYGRASIEQFDRGGETSDVPEILDMDALENALDRFFNSEKAPGIISIGHDDIPVGRPLEEYTLDEATTLQIDGEQYQFDAGEKLTTHVEDGDGDGKPELWGLADLANDTRIARAVRLGVLLGDIDGYSVTFGRHPEAVTPEGPGRRVGSLDLFSWTLAPSEMVANPGAEFDLAGFKARYGLNLGTEKGGPRPPVEVMSAGQKAGGFGIDVYEVLAPKGEEDEFNGELLGIAVDFPESDVYVDWRREAFPDQLEDPHVSIYGSIEDLEKATNNRIQLAGEFSADDTGAVAEAVAAKAAEEIRTAVREMQP